MYFFWNICRYSIEHVLLAILLSLEQMIQDPEVQVHGFAIIVDWSQFSFRQAARLSPAQMRLVIEGLQVRATVMSLCTQD